MDQDTEGQQLNPQSENIGHFHGFDDDDYGQFGQLYDDICANNSLEDPDRNPHSTEWWLNPSWSLGTGTDDSSRPSGAPGCANTAYVSWPGEEFEGGDQWMDPFGQIPPPSHAGKISPRVSVEVSSKEGLSATSPESPGMDSTRGIAEASAVTAKGGVQPQTGGASLPTASVGVDSSGQSGASPRVKRTTALIRCLLDDTRLEGVTMTLEDGTQGGCTAEDLRKRFPASRGVLLKAGETCARASQESPCSEDGTALAEEKANKRSGKIQAFISVCQAHFSSGGYRWTLNCEDCTSEMKCPTRATMAVTWQVGGRQRSYNFRCFVCDLSRRASRKEAGAIPKKRAVKFRPRFAR